MSAFTTLGLAIALASIFGFFARTVKQPLFIGYLFAGIVLAVFGVFSRENSLLIENMAQLGITLLLFLVGLEMSFKDLPRLGSVALLGASAQMIITSILAFFLAMLLGFSPTSSLYIAISLTFASTIIVVKLLSEKKDLGSLYGKIVVGVLLVQDFVAILILVLLSGFQEGDLSLVSFLWVLAKGALLILGVYLLSKTLLQKFFDRVAEHSTELLFVTSIAWALLLAGIVSSPWIGFSIEIGGFLAGVALANSSEHLQIASRVKPLRDFFITTFFLLLGAQMVVGITPEEFLPALVLSLFVIIGHPLILLLILVFLGFRRRTSFLAAITTAQISEFSFIILAVGAKVGHIDSSEVSLITLVGVLTMTFSTYIIINAHKIYIRLERPMRFLERKRTKEGALGPRDHLENHIVLIGADRAGKALLPVLEKRVEPLVIMDFNPSLVERLTAQGYNAVYGDASDSETLDLLELDKAHLLLSTTDSLDDDLFLLDRLKKLPHQPISIFMADSALAALKLYGAGATYVVVPQIAGGEHIAHVISTQGVNRENLKRLKDKHFDRLIRERFE
ncbi:MAG: cation:proton antiporter [bacterium]|nr:cation:proton antiporter [bacterium]